MAAIELAARTTRRPPLALTDLFCGGWVDFQMSDFRSRLFQERTDLLQKIEKLKAFIVGETFDELELVDRTDLRSQLGHMENYASVLERRVSRQCNSA